MDQTLVQISIKSNVREISKSLSLVEREQVPYATMWTIARLGNLAREAVVSDMDKVFDRPTPNTKKGVRVAWVTKNEADPVFKIFLNEWAKKGTPQATYLYPEVEGGERNETRFERALRFAGVLPAGMAVVPGKGAPLDRYGNVKNGIATSVLSQVQANAHSGVNENETVRSRKRAGKNRARYFVGRPGGGRLPLGIYQRLAHGVKPIFIFVGRRPTYRPRLPFYALVQAVVDAQFEGIFRAALDQAMRTAK
jgi:hypothetical protein